MRAGGSCTLQQALTPEAASLVKQALTLAKRRGHTQVTPLHVAATMLTASTGLLRAACLRSNSHPLQCKALELCFNVALNRLPAAASASMSGVHGTGNFDLHHCVPSISNALIAAFKRAQANQRRGSIESNQSILVVKIELDQLVISILDDPSVSRVMREAGFSSSEVKSNVEHVVLSEMNSPSTPSPVHITAHINSRDMNLNNMQSNTPHLPPSSENGSKRDHSNLFSQVIEEDVRHVMENLIEKRRRSIVIVGESTDTIESVVRGLTNMLSNGSFSDDVAQTFRGVKLIDISLPSFEHLSKEGVEQKLEELRAHLRSNHFHMMMGSDISNGLILFVGDLRWVAENRANSAIELLVAELEKLICGLGEDERVWVMGMATLQGYMRCKSGYPSLESIWRLHPVAVPVGSLSFSLISDSDVESGCSSIKKCESGSLSSSWLLHLGVGDHHQSDEHLACCVDCSSVHEKEARSLRSSLVYGNSNHSFLSLPPWLQQYKDEKNGSVTYRDDGGDYVRDLRRKWNSIRNSIHGQSQSSERHVNLSYLSPPSSSSSFSYELLSNPSTNLANQTTVDYNAWIGDPSAKVSSDLNPSRRDSPPNLGSSSDDVMEVEYFQRFKELGEKNMRLLVEKLEEKVPLQKRIIPDIASTILRCRSGMIKRKRNIVEDDYDEIKNETWFLFQGTDRDGKEKIARELARLVFGSYHSLISISLSSQSREEKSCSDFEEFAEAVSDNPHRVFFIEDIAEADRSSREHLKRAIEGGKLSKSCGDEVDLKDAIVIISQGSLTPRSTMGSPTKQKQEDEERERNPSLSLDLNLPIAHGDSGTDHHHPNIIEFTEYVDKLILFKIQEL